MKKTTFLLISFMLILIASNAQTNTAPSDSMILVEYYKLKGPKLNKAWEIEDYTKAGEVIQKLKEKGNEHLPRQKGAFSGQILDKITNPKNYDFFLKSNEVDVKLQSILAMSELTNKLFTLYFSGYRKNGVLIFSNEVTQFSIATIYLMDIEMTMVQDFIKDSPEMNAEQDNSIKQMQSGLNYLIKGSLKTLIMECAYYEREDIASFANAFFPFYYKLKSPILSNETKEEADREIEIIIQRHPLKELRRAARNKPTLHENN